ncbi:hypothetical protein [Plesiocystis pacifica]|nr:hypothetical protein [Plesiocystis pacifica]
MAVDRLVAFAHVLDEPTLPIVIAVPGFVFNAALKAATPGAA